MILKISLYSLGYTLKVFYLEKKKIFESFINFN